MLVSKDLKFVFLRNYKTGAHTITETFGHLNIIQPIECHGTMTGLYNNDKILYLDVVENYDKYFVVRNPWSHAVSRYFHQIDTIVGHSDMDKYRSFEVFLKDGLYEPQSMRTFNDPLFNGNQWIPIKFENLDEEIKNLCEKYNVEYTPKKLHVTKNRKNKLNLIYPENYRTMYLNNEMIEIVKSLSENEIRIMNYEF